MKLFKITTALIAFWSFSALAENAPQETEQKKTPVVAENYPQELTLPTPQKAVNKVALKPLKVGGGVANGGYNSVARKIKLSRVKPSSDSEPTPKVRIIATGGSVTNIKAIKNGEFSGGIAQANIADAAVRGTGIFSADGPVKELRSIARLYPEYVHFVVKADSPIKSIADLKGKHVGLGSAGSGTLEASVKILQTHGIKELDVNGYYSRISQIIDTFKRGKLDAFFFISKSPSSILAKLHEETPIKVIAIDGPQRDQFLRDNENFVPASIEGVLYGVEGDVNTLSVSAQLFVSKNLNEEHAYEIAKNLWESNSKDVKSLNLDRTLAINSLAAPLHPGAATYYREQKVLRN